LREGLYKVEFHTAHGTGIGVIYAHAGKLHGGNSAFAYKGSYSDDGEDIHARVSTERHTSDPAFPAIFGIDMVTVTLKGRDNGGIIDFEGNALQAPGVALKATLIRISD
jgi:hypothetical protein